MRGAFTLWRRLGFRYFAYLVGEHARLRALYRFAWGPRASRPARAAFDLPKFLASRPASRLELQTAGLVNSTAVLTRRQLDARAAADLMDRAHAAGVTGLHRAFDHVGHDRASIRFTAMPGARMHRWRGAYYLAARDADRRSFNERFGTSLLTEAEARRQLTALKSRISTGYRNYAPIDFGGGLSTGRIASTDSGTGRWTFFNQGIVGPLVAGKRVLDLGCNNGSLTLMMLRAGARDVVAIELTSPIAELARFNARILEWRDACRYRLNVVTGDMRMWLSQDLGSFDVVTAFCSLYYLPEIDMARVIRKAANMGATLILQANEAIDNLPARTRPLRRLMRDNGYGAIDEFSAVGFPRPLLVGAGPTSNLISARSERR